ncbi:MAG: phosphoglycerate kinase [Candidatus Gracilibacteria bacterium]|nr:phosphoglycerate kinase [Candidatus Gracilibacteria bacterium]
MIQIRTISKIPEIKGKKVLLRVDFNVPISKETGEIQDDTRIVEALNTINYLRLKGAKLIIMSHLGRPDGEVKEELRLTKIAQHLEKLLEVKVKKLDQVIGNEVKKAISEMKDGEIIMLENLRFHSEEEKCEENFTKELANLGEIFVNDAFGTAHRKHSSTAGIANYLPAYGGLLIDKEIRELAPLLTESIARPLTMIFGGSKIDTKIGIIKNFINKADYFLIGGGLANTFLNAAGYNTGQSLCEKEKLHIAQEIMLECEKNREKLILPKDVVVAGEVNDEAETATVPVQDVLGDMKILDIGRLTADRYCEVIQKSGTVIWNGPLGVTEYKPFQNGSRMIADCLANHPCTSIIGGGDTADCIKKLNIPVKAFTHISTGGGACIEFLEGKSLPGIEILEK